MRVPAFAYLAFYRSQHPTPRRSHPKPAHNPWDELEWWQHPEAIRAVNEHPNGMTLEEIGRHMGITRERVRQVEATALRKLKECSGDEVINVGRFAVAIPDCERCDQPYIRRNGRDRRCDLCEAKRRKNRRSRAHISPALGVAQRTALHPLSSSSGHVESGRHSAA